AGDIVWHRSALSDSLLQQVIGTGAGTLAAVFTGLLDDPGTPADSALRTITVIRSMLLARHDGRAQQATFIYGAALAMLGKFDELQKFAQGLLPTDQQNGYVMMLMPS